MPHISLPEGLYGMTSLRIYRPDVYARLGPLGELLLHTPTEGLSCADREIIGAYVSSLNECAYCQTTHGAVAVAHLDNDEKLVSNIISDYQNSEATLKLKALLAIAGQVQKGGKFVTVEMVERARLKGATDLDIHDTVLIAAMFCMFNRYVDGLDTLMPEDPGDVKKSALILAEHGYERRPLGNPAQVDDKGAGA